MKNTRTVRCAAFALALLLAASLSGCADAQQGAQAPSRGERQETAAGPGVGTGTAGGSGTAVGAGTAGGTGTAGEELQVEVAETVTGEVESIVGNEVTLLPEGGGDAAAYLLPVGMSVGSGDYSSVTAGMTLSLSLDAEGRVVAASVLAR
ncbi:MAG: hypothetical protein ACOX83_07685 [Candidatus Spyradocola sp.]|jgi:hypothetical protein